LVGSLTKWRLFDVIITDTSKSLRTQTNRQRMKNTSKKSTAEEDDNESENDYVLKDLSNLSGTIKLIPDEQIWKLGVQG